MRLHKLMFVLLFIIAGCSSNLSREEWDVVEEGMSIQSIEKELGNPTTKLIEQREILDEINSVINKDDDMLTNPAIAFALNSSPEVVELLALNKEDLESLHDKATNNEDVKIYQYKIESENDDLLYNVYFHKDKVFHYNGMYVEE